VLRVKYRIYIYIHNKNGFEKQTPNKRKAIFIIIIIIIIPHDEFHPFVTLFGVGKTASWVAIQVAG